MVLLIFLFCRLGFQDHGSVCLLDGNLGAIKTKDIIQNIMKKSQHEIMLSKKLHRYRRFKTEEHYPQTTM